MVVASWSHILFAADNPYFNCFYCDTNIYFKTVQHYSKLIADNNSSVYNAFNTDVSKSLFY